MNSEVNVRDGRFASSDGLHEIFYKVWEPTEPARAVLQISHGMCEHIDRYDGFARDLCDRGIIVCASEHLGHGRSVNDDSELGYFGGKGSHAFLADDLDKLRAEMRKKYRRLPYILFGHSMGSFVARDYIARYGENIDGAVICGTAGTNKLINIAIGLSNVIGGLRGKKHRSDFIRNLAFAGYNKNFPNEGLTAWLTRDKAVRDAYDADPLCGFTFTVGGYNEMFRLLKDVSGAQWAERVPQSLPVFVVAGAMDPVGANGEGPREVYQLLCDRELTDVDCKIYDDMRHEIHNEIGRDEVIGDIADWALRVAEGVAEASGLQ